MRLQLVGLEEEGCKGCGYMNEAAGSLVRGRRLQAAGLK